MNDEEYYIDIMALWLNDIRKKYGIPASSALSRLDGINKDISKKVGNRYFEIFESEKKKKE